MPSLVRTWYKDNVATCWLDESYLQYASSSRVRNIRYPRPPSMLAWHMAWILDRSIAQALADLISTNGSIVDRLPISHITSRVLYTVSYHRSGPCYYDAKLTAANTISPLLLVLMRRIHNSTQSEIVIDAPAAISIFGKPTGQRGSLQLKSRYIPQET